MNSAIHLRCKEAGWGALRTGFHMLPTQLLYTVGVLHLFYAKKTFQDQPRLGKKRYPPFYSTINIKKLSCTCTENCYTCTSTRFTSVGGADVMCNPFTSFHSQSSGCTPVPYGPYRLFFTSSLGLRRLCTAGDRRLDVQLAELPNVVLTCNTPPTSTPFESFASPLVHLEASPIHLVHPYRCAHLCTRGAL